MASSTDSALQVGVGLGGKWFLFVCQMEDKLFSPPQNKPLRQELTGWLIIFGVG